MLNHPGNAVQKAGNVLRDLCILWLVTLITRASMLGIAEPDSALFATGIRQWLRGGPENLSIYSAQVCGFYYATIALLIRSFELSEQDCVFVMSLISMLACLGILTFSYLLGLRFVGSHAALTSMLLFAFSPGLWRISAEPHPQALSICLALGAVWSFCRYLESKNLAAAFGSLFLLSLAIAMKIDAILTAPALMALVLWINPKLRNTFAALAVAGCSFAFALELSRFVLRGDAQLLAAGKQSLNIFAHIPHLFDFFKQCVPIVFGFGLITVLTVLIAFFFERGKLAHTRQSWAVMAVWCLPGYLFWLFIAGNNARHVVFFGIPLFWLGASFLRMRYALLCLGVSLLVPANSDTGLFPSPNVPGSVRLLAKRKQEMEAVAESLSLQPSCFIGSYTNDYIVSDLLDRGGRVLSEISPSDVSTAEVETPTGNVVTFKRIGSGDRTLHLGSCQSLEYRPDGRRVHYLGSEWRIFAR